MNKVLEYIIGAKDKTGNAIKSAWDRIRSFASNVLGQLANIKAGFDMAFGVARRFAGLFSAAIGEAFRFEKAKSDFTGLLNSIDKAKEHISDLRQFASSTPLTFDDLSQASKLLLSFGMSVDDVMPSMKMLGDIAMGDSQKFQGLALVFAQVKSAGKLMGQDLLQMINQGFNPLTVISKQTGKSVSELKDIMAEGGISFEIVAEAMRLATVEGGLFNNAMDNASKTGSGLISTLQDKWTDAVRTFGEAFSDAAKDGIQLLIEKLTRLVEDGTVEVWANRVAKSLNSIVDVARDCAKAISWIVNAYQKIRELMENVGTFVGSSIGAVMNTGYIDDAVRMARDNERARQQAEDIRMAEEAIIRKEAKERASNKRVLDDRYKQTKTMNEMLAESEAQERIKAEQKVAKERSKLMRKQMREAMNSVTLTSKRHADAQTRLANASSKVEQMWQYYEDPDGWRKYQKEVVAAQEKRREAQRRFWRDYRDMKLPWHNSVTDDLTRAMASALKEEEDAKEYVKITAEAAKKAAENLERLNQHFEEGKAE